MNQVGKWVSLSVASLLFHGLLGLAVFFVADNKPKIKSQKIVKMRIRKVVEPKPIVEKPVVEEKKAPKPKPKTKPKPKPKKKKIKKKKKAPKVERKPKTPPKKKAAPVQGMAPESLVKGANGIAVPIGNTLMREDEGKRLKADEVSPLAQDLTAEAQLIRNTLTTPEYTEDAIYAGLEGVFTIEVFVDKFGVVGEVDIPSPIGYGMDERIKTSLENSKFVPRKNKAGKSLSGWTEVQFVLEIP